MHCTHTLIIKYTRPSVEALKPLAKCMKYNGTVCWNFKPLCWSLKNKKSSCVVLMNNSIWCLHLMEKIFLFLSSFFYLYMCVAELVDEAHPERICGNLVINQTNNSEGNMLGARKVVLHFFFCICFFSNLCLTVNFRIFTYNVQNYCI